MYDENRISNSTDEAAPYLLVADIFAEILEEKVAQMLRENFVEGDFSILLEMLAHHTPHTVE